MKYTLPKLPYKELPGFSAMLFEYHHGKHHKAYVDNLNKLIPDTQFEDMSLEEIVDLSSGKIYENAAQHWNHTFLWKCMKDEHIDPSSEFVDAIDEGFGEFENFKKKFIEAGTNLFGSGWVSLIHRDIGSGKLMIRSHKDADSPIECGTPLLIVDIWEHAYYIDYFNDRPAYLEAFWNIIDWDFVSDNYKNRRKT